MKLLAHHILHHLSAAEVESESKPAEFPGLEMLTHLVRKEIWENPARKDISKLRIIV